MKNKALYSFLIFMAMTLIAFLTYKNYSEPESAHLPDTETAQKKKGGIEEKSPKAKAIIQKRDKVSLTANQEINGTKIQLLYSRELEGIAASSSSMNELVNKISKDYEYPVSFSLNVLMTAISNFENDLKYDLFFNEDSAYKELLEQMSSNTEINPELQRKFQETLKLLKNNDNKVEVMNSYISLLHLHQSVVSTGITDSKLKNKLIDTNDFFYGSLSLAETKNFEEAYTEKVCNTLGDSFKEKRLNFKSFHGSSIVEEQFKIYDYILRVLPRRLPITKRYERLLLDSFNTLHIPHKNNKKETPKEYYVNKNKSASISDVELLGDFYIRQAQFYSKLEEKGQKFLSKDFIAKVTIIKNFFIKLNNEQNKVPRGEDINATLTDAELAVINFDKTQEVTVNTIGLDDTNMKISAILEPAAMLKVQLFNKKQSRVILPFYQKSNFKLLTSQK